MKMKLLSTCSCLLFAAILAGCTSETEQVGASTGGPGTDNNDNRREVALILKNDLALRSGQPAKSGGETAPSKATAALAGPTTGTTGTTTTAKQFATKADQLTTKTNQPATKADTPIAMADENLISSLDVYVFASATENGEYTFQERFAYRADANEALPAGATELKLTAAGGDTKETTGLLKLKKGLFVKLYCIANSISLIGPDGNEVADAAFTPLVFSEDGKGVKTEGQPKESVFISYHTPLLTATEAKDVLTTPLAMSGAYTTPLDLTDFESSARMQASFKLTRLAARFDIINNAETSKFTIESVSMGKGRRGATFFPIRIYGDTPTAKDGELITYPERAFDGDNANIGIQTGAFYSYPSPKEDEAYLILKGTYQVNKTESKEVTYQVPFRTSSVSGDGSYLEINNNHRYTLAITEADDYHLDFTLNVADWTDDGSIDDYTPGTDTGAIEIKVPAGDTETKYDVDNHTVTMSLNGGTTFDMVMEKTSPILPVMTKTYTGGLAAQKYDWLEIIKPTTTASAPLSKAGSSDVAAGEDTAADGYKYTFALNADYKKNRYPRAIVRFKNLTNGEETVLFVDALAAPTATTTIQEGKNNHNTFDPETLEADVYRLTDSNLRIKLLCSAGVELDGPTWLTSKLLSENNGELLYSFTLNDVDAAPEGNKSVIVFKNAKYLHRTLSVNVNLLVPDITPDFSQLGGDSNNSFTDASGSTPANISMRIAKDNTFKFTSTSLEGININMNFADGPAWLHHDGEAVVTKAGTVPNIITFYLVKDKLLGAKPATITLKNKTVGGGKDYIFTVTPDFVEPELTSAATMTLEAKADKAVPTIEIKGNCFGGSSIVADESPEWLTYETTSTTDDSFTYKVSLVPDDNKTNFPTSLPTDQTITLASTINPDKKTTVAVSFIDKGWVEESINEDEAYANGSNPKTEYRVKTAGKTLTLTAYSMFAPLTVETGYESGYGTNTSWLPQPTAPKTTGYGDNRKKFTYEIVVPASSGTDPKYQLHKGTITVKQGTSELKKITLWRGASNIPYPSGRSDNAYYSAVKKGGSWFAPLNLGATQIATDATNVAGTGKLYQWGRNVPTFHGGSKITGPVDADSNAEFITSTPTNRYDWLKVQNDNLWGKPKTAKDPCPAGWRVPTVDELRKWDSGTWDSPLFKINGENDGLQLVLPATGSRSGYTGDSNNPGKHGYFWSSSPKGQGSWTMFIYGSSTGISDFNRVGAFSVRCVQE